MGDWDTTGQPRSSAASTTREEPTTMRDLNNVQLIGHLGHDPEVRYLDNGTALTTFNIATHHSYPAGEEWQTETEWHRCAAWGQAG